MLIRLIKLENKALKAFREESTTDSEDERVE